MSEIAKNLGLMRDLYRKDTIEAARLGIIFPQDVEESQRQLYYYGQDVDVCVKVRMQLIVMNSKIRIVDMNNFTIEGNTESKWKAENSKDNKEYCEKYDEYMRKYLGYRLGTTLTTPENLLRSLKKFEKKWVEKYGT